MADREQSPQGIQDDSGESFPEALVGLLRCPVDKAPLRVEPLGSGEILLAGPSLSYPVLLGIPRLIDDPLRRQLVALMRAGHHDAAERLVLRWPTFSLVPRLRRRFAQELCAMAPDAVWLGLLLSRLVDGGAIRQSYASFVNLVRTHSSGLYGDWFAYRFTARTFLPIAGLSKLLPSAGPILEIGPGCGHSTFILGRHLCGEPIVAVDHQFAQLYAAKRFMAPRAHYICADVEQGLPLAADAFTAVVMSDTFHFVHAKQQLAGEIGRVAQGDATLVLSQVHNGLFPELWAGEPLVPAGYAALFAAWAPRIIRNDRLIERMTTEDSFDLTDPGLAADISSERSLSLVGQRGAGQTDRVVAISHGVLARKTRLVLDPAVNWTAGRLEPRNGIDPVVAQIVMPPYLVGLDNVADAPDPEQSDPTTTADLLRRRILLDVPAQYL